MILACKRCEFLFERITETHTCPNCGRDTVTEANPDEQEKYAQGKIAPLANQD